MNIAQTTMRVNIQTILADTAAATWPTAQLNLLMADSLREIAQYYPHILMLPYQVEGRYGTAEAAGTSTHLADSTKAQFVSTDADKVIYNATDRTWATVTAAASAGDITLSKAIMASGEKYYMLNKGCTQQNQINIADAPDRIGIQDVEYPLGYKRNVDRIEGDILTIGFDDRINDTAQSTAYKDVAVYYKFPHYISPLTDLAGVVASTAAAAATTLACSGMQAAGTVEIGQEFTLPNHRYTYRVAASATIASNTVSITFAPALEVALASTGVVVTFKQSTLPDALEPIYANYVAGKAALDRCSYLAVNQLVAGAAPYTALKAWGEEKIGKAKREVQRYAGSRLTFLYART